MFNMLLDIISKPSSLLHVPLNAINRSGDEAAIKPRRVIALILKITLGQIGNLCVTCLDSQL